MSSRSHYSSRQSQHSSITPVNRKRHRSGSVSSFTSNGSRRSIGSHSQRSGTGSGFQHVDFHGESRRNLTGTLARSVQNAAAVQRNIERNILSLRDGQCDVVDVLREVLQELRRRNDN